MKGIILRQITYALVFLLLAFQIGWVQKSEANQFSQPRQDWLSQDVNLRMTGGGSIKTLYYPNEKPLPLHSNQAGQSRLLHKKTIKKNLEFRFPISDFWEESAPGSAAPTLNPVLPVPSKVEGSEVEGYVIDSPPVDGFIPWIVVSVTDERLGDLELDAVPETSVVGRFPRGVNHQKDYVIGIFDIGASAHVMGYADATRAGLFNGFQNLVTSNTIVIGGVIGTVDVWVSQPLALFVDGLSAIDSNDLLLDNSQMLGQSNVAITVGQNPGDGPDLPTVIGSPLSVFFTTVIDNDHQITVIRDKQEFKGPDVRLYEHQDPCIPAYQNMVPLELRPAGATSVQYIPSLEGFFEFPPAIPSIIVGNLSQSLFFVHSVDLVDSNNSALDKDRFLLDTGAQITVIGSRIAARLRLNPNEPEFEVEIEDVTGQTIIAPGFYIDSIQIPAIGDWLSYTNVPVVLLDVASPEGGTVDGIIGMNLFVDFNMVLRGGGLLLDEEPALFFAPVSMLVVDNSSVLTSPHQ
jgi:predicted aspartyl protease